MRSGQIPTNAEVQCDKAKPPIAIQGSRPVRSELASLQKHGEWSFAHNARGRTYLVAALDAGSGVRRWCVLMQEVTDDTD